MTKNVRLQNLRNCTVQIRVAGADTIVGTGIAVSMDGHVVTCAHVAEAALGVHPRQANGGEVGVYFPQAGGREKKDHRAKVAGCFSQHDDDVVLLQLADGYTPLGPEQIAVLGAADQSDHHPFRSYGYRRLDDYLAGHAHGLILGPVDAPVGRSVQTEPVQLESKHINHGMSGAAVLDVERNLVVGVVSETWFPDLSTKDRDTAWAVDARVLTFDPLNLPLRHAPLPLRPAPRIHTDMDAARRAAAPDLGIAWNHAPPPLPEWVGRVELLEDVTYDWATPDRHVTGLIGFGGEGKSSLAHKWVEMLGDLANCPTPEGVFWWGFYDRPSVDEFFEAALVYLSGKTIDPRRHPSASARVHFIAGMLHAGRYLFVLDGLEVLQRQDDRYGLLTSADLRDFLRYFAAPGHDSFCLVTSRAPLLDLMDYVTYTHRNVPRLNAQDGRDLMLAIVGQAPRYAQDDVGNLPNMLDKLVSDWDGHALTLGLLGSYLAEEHAGDLAHADQIPPPTANEPRYERVHRVLRRYDEHLTAAERAFLTMFSTFRTPVEESAFDRVFRARVEKKLGVFGHLLGRKPKVLIEPSILNAPVAALDDAAFKAMIKRLMDYRILRHDPHAGHYTTHPLIRAHYFARLTAGERAQETHAQVKDYYLELAGDTPYHPTMDDLAPLIEVVYHACRAGACDEAWQVFQEHIDQDRAVIVSQLGAYESALALLLEFFPDGDTSQYPQVSSPDGKRFILNGVGLCLVGLGRLGEAAPFFERSNAIALGMEDWSNASVGYRNLAELYAHLGALADIADAAREALALARRAEDKFGECQSMAYQAWAAHLGGDLDVASKIFQQAEAVERERDSDIRYLYSNRGIFHADHLRRAGDPAYARRVTEANLKICEQYRVVKDRSLCHRVLGDLDADAGQHESARQHYEQALEIARGITYRPALIEALLARGRDLTGFKQPQVANLSGLDNLNEALGYALEGGYQVYEADIRVALAWAHRAAGDGAAARVEAQRARRMSVGMGYYWGQKDAEEILDIGD